MPKSWYSNCNWGINILDDENGDDKNDYLNILNEYDCSSVINAATRIQGDTKTFIDHMFIKYDGNSVDSLPIVLQTSIMDHFEPIVKIKSFGSEKSNKKTRKYLNKNKLVDSLEKENFLWSVFEQ